MARPLPKTTVAILAGALLLSREASAATDRRIVDRYRQMLAANPADDSALDKLWKIAREDGFADKLLQDYAGNDLSSVLIHAGLLHRAGKTGEAREALAHAVQRYSKSPLPHLALARLAPPAEAAASLETALTLLPKGDPAFGPALDRLGELWQTAGDPEKAAVVWEKRVALTPENVELRQRLAAFYLEKNKASQAAAHFSWLNEHGDAPTRANALRGLARLHGSSGDAEAALKALEGALALIAPDNWLHGELVSEAIQAARRGGLLPQLEARWKRDAETNPRLSAAWLRLADLYFAQGNAAAERAALEKAAELSAGDIALKVRFARVLVRTDDLAGAAVQLDAALAAQARAGQAAPDLILERAELDIRRGDAAAARKRVDALADSSDEALAARALAFFQKYRMWEAIEARLRRPGADPAALAEFLFAQHRAPEARALLRRLVRPEDPPKTCAEAHERVAGLLKQAGETVAALAELREAARLQPESRRLQIALGDALLAGGSRLTPGGPGAAAREAYTRALDLSATEADRIDADRHLFRSFERENAGRPAASASEARRTVEELFAIPASEGAPGSADNIALREFIAGLETSAMHSRGAEGSAAWLRLARWHLWDRDLESAKAAAAQAIALAPDAAPPRELAVLVAQSSGDRTAALAQLRQLAKTAAEPRKAGYLKQVAQLQMQTGEREEALALFKELAVSGSPGAMADLATAQQQADRWIDALATWEQIYAAGKKGRRHEYLGPVIRVMQRLQIDRRAAELLWSALLEHTAEPAHSNILHEAIGHCRDHGLMPWLLEKLQARASLTGDPADAVALAAALKADGRVEEADRHFEGAARSAPDRARAEEELVRQAEAERDFVRAAAHQKTRLDTLASPAAGDWEKLAALRESAFDYAGADAAREEIVRRFPRDSDALTACARAFEKCGRADRAIAIVRAVRGFDPAHLPAAAMLGRLLDRARPVSESARREAAQAAEAVLAKTPNGIASDSLTLPPVPASGVSRIQAYLSTFASEGASAAGVAVFDPSPDTEREWRLEAIRRLSANLDEAARKRWIIRWQDAASPSEKLWALCYSGARKEAFAHLAGLARRAPGNSNRRFALVWCALRMGAWKELGGWVSHPDRTAADHETFQAVLGERCALDTDWSADPAIPGGPPPAGEAQVLKELFAHATPAQLWPCARVLANRRRLPAAIALGRRAFEGLPFPRAEQGLALANWMLALGDTTQARTILQAASAEPADSADAPAFAALRALYLLTPESERAHFVERTLAGGGAGPALSGDARSPVRDALAEAVLKALQGGGSAGRPSLDRLLKLRFTPPGEAAGVERAWSFLLATGVQFQRWNLNEAAAYLWDRALADEASIELQGERATQFAGEMRLRLAAIRLAAAMPARLPERLEETAANLTVADSIRLAELLQNAGYRGEALRVLERAQEIDPNAPLPRLLGICAETGDNASAEAAIARWLGRSPSDAVSAQASIEFLCVRDAPNAGPFVEKLANCAAGGTRSLEALSRLQRKLERWDAAQATLEKLVAADPRSPEMRAALADTLLAAGRPQVAVKILNEAPRRTAMLDAKTAEALAAAGDFVRARIAASDVLKTAGSPGADAAGPPALRAVAAAFAKRGRPEDGLALLASAAEIAAESRRPHAAFELQSALVDAAAEATGSNSAPTDPRRPRWLHRLKVLAGDRPELLFAYYDLLSGPHGLPAAERRREFAADWDEGHGPAVSGAWLAADLAASGKTDEAGVLLNTLLPRADLGAPLLAWLDDRLGKAGARELVPRVTTVLYQCFPGEPEHAIRHARALHGRGRDAEAAAVLSRAALRAVFVPDLHGHLGLAALECGNAALAREWLGAAVANDPAAQQSGAWLAYARLLTRDGDFSAAKRILRQAYRNPVVHDPAPVVEYLRASGREPVMEMRDLELRPEIQRAANVLSQPRER